MPFVLRVTEMPDLATILELERIVIVDQTGPAVTVGVSAGAACLFGEFVKGPFVPTEVTSGGEIVSLFGNVSSLLSQDVIGSTAVQDGSGGAFDGNGALQLKQKKFRRLILVRVDTDMVTTDGGTGKGVVEFDVSIAAADEDPTDATKTGKAIVIPAGTRFADDTVDLAAVIVALSQDVTIPKGTTITGGKVTVDETYGATAFFVLGTTAGSGVIDTCLDTALPNVSSTIDASTGISTLTSAGAPTAVWPPGTGATLKARIASRYPAAIDKTIPSSTPVNVITVMWAARRGSAIRQYLRDNAVSSSGQGRGRVACVSADPADSDSFSDAEAALTAALALTTTENLQVDRIFASFPYLQVFSTELGSVNVVVSPDGFRAMMCSLLPEEYQTSVPNQVMVNIQAMEDAFGVTRPLAEGDYIRLKAAGIGAVIHDFTTGWQFQSGVTGVNPVAQPTRVADNRRRFADFVQDTLVSLSAKYQKFPGTTERVDALTSEIESFLDGLLSPNDPSQQRIEDYTVDAVSGNTPQLTAVGIRVIIVQVRMLGDLNDIVFNTQIGPTVIIVRQAA